jgi:hypothetical protein
VKNQWFGDKNDFFKFDLALTLIDDPNLKCFTYIPMLTTDDQPRNDDSRRPELSHFLRSCVKAPKRNIKNLRSFMSENYRRIEYHPYRDDKLFSHEGEERKEYFDGIPESCLNECLILIDPDTGFDPDPAGYKDRAEYLKYDELSDLHGRMKSSSLLLVYQHLPRSRDMYFGKIGKRVRIAIGKPGPVCVSNNVVAFFIIAKDHELLNETWSIIEDYAKKNYANRTKKTPYLSHKCGSDLRSA